MHQYKIIARILLILPIINFAFALPMAVQETRMYFDPERLSGKPDSDLAGLKGLQPEAPDHGSMDPLQKGTNEIQQPELSKSPSFDHYLASPASPASEASLDHYLASESDASDVSADDYHYLGSPDPESGSSRSAESESDLSTTSSSMEKPESKSFLSKVFSKVSKLKFWRRISSPDSVRDAVNAAQDLVDTGAYVSASSPESQTFLLYDFP